ncbi:T1SS secreted agglutinin RTX [Vibrio ishigakensis]|uniref:T1SS secreted agglutinin RTX n=1 Tax=Vibrio ishigakensis TaxID=1481914 RepID=A0A0B8Q5E1_9VIBR|nr:T1SS secreted agglutinin RTX [Vibrio ishigakensis]
MVASANGTVDIHNREKGIDLVFTADHLKGQYGEFTLDKDSGEWTYTLDSKGHQDLAQGETHTEVMQVTATNTFGLSKTLEVTVTVKGTNDIPVITSQAQTGATKEDDVLSASGQVTASDIDHGAVLTYTPDNTQANMANSR